MDTHSLSLRAADNIRILALSMVEKANSGHPGGAMGGADFIHILFSEYMVYSPSDPHWIARDRFFLDPGHMSPMLYAVLALSGRMSVEDLQAFRQWQSVTPGHPERDLARGIENTSGPLGQGHTMAVGAAIAAKKMEQKFGSLMRQRIFAYISDGGIQEEISQGAGRIAGHLGLDNLVMFYDANQIQLSTEVKDVTSEDTAAKYRAWGWEVYEIDGNDHLQIRKALDDAIALKGKPALIIGNTLMGKGARGNEGSMENLVSTHGQPLSKAGADIAATIENLGGDPQSPFAILPQVKELYDARSKELQEDYNEWMRMYHEWQKEDKALNKELELWLSRRLPEIDWEAIEQKPDSATRSASATVLSHLAQHVPNMVVASADLSNSDKTDGFLKHTKVITKDDFSGGFLQVGVSELTMASIMVGVALHGGLIAACGTFFVFSDYMKPVVRLAALMEVPVKFIWTHDAFRVGEDGPTHEPVEQEAQIRLMEKLRNHSGESSVLVLRPADVHETTAAWMLAMENTKTPTALILSRQDIKTLPGNTFVRSKKIALGGYVVKEVDQPKAILVANGSEVSTLIEGAILLEEQGISCNVVSVPSEELFRKQTEQYQEEVLPVGIPRFGLTAGLPVTLAGLVGEHGRVWGMESFGFSAPYKVLDKKLGFTPENVVNQVKIMLES